MIEYSNIRIFDSRRFVRIFDFQKNRTNIGSKNKFKYSKVENSFEYLTIKISFEFSTLKNSFDYSIIKNSFDYSTIENSFGYSTPENSYFWENSIFIACCVTKKRFVRLILKSSQVKEYFQQFPTVLSPSHSIKIQFIVYIKYQIKTYQQHDLLIHLNAHKPISTTVQRLQSVQFPQQTSARNLSTCLHFFPHRIHKPKKAYKLKWNIALPHNVLIM